MSSPGMKSATSSGSLTSLSEEKKISRREEVTRKIEERKLAKESHLTFRPTIKKSSSSISLSEEPTNESRFDKLYGEAKKRKDAERRDVTYSFQPIITSKGQKRSSTPEGTSRRLYDAPGAGKPRRSGSVDKSRERSFSPQITSRGRSVERPGTVSSSTTRLYDQAQTQKQNREALVSKISQESAKECTFAPKTNSDSKGTGTGVPLSERMDKYLAAREKRMADLKEKQQAQEKQATTFKPNSFTSGRSPSVERRDSAGRQATKQSADAESVAPTNSVFDRLSNATPQKSKKNGAYVGNEEKELTFKPKIVSKRCPSPQRQEEDSKYGSVHNRLYQKGNEQRVEGKLKTEQLRRQMEKEHTFAPSVPGGHRTSAPSSPTKGAVFERLSASRQYVHEILSQVKTEFELDNCTFHPEINKASDESWSKKHTEPAYMRLSAEAGRLREENEKRQALKQEEELVDCTFSPAIDKKSSKMGGKRTGKETVFDRLSLSASSAASAEPTSPPVQENFPANVPKVIRRSTIEKLAQSNGVIKESGSPKKAQQQVEEQESGADDAQGEMNERGGKQGEVDTLVPISPVTVLTREQEEQAATEEFFQDDGVF